MRSENSPGRFDRFVRRHPWATVIAILFGLSYLIIQYAWLWDLRIDPSLRTANPAMRNRWLLGAIGVALLLADAMNEGRARSAIARGPIGRKLAALARFGSQHPGALLAFGLLVGLQQLVAHWLATPDFEASPDVQNYVRIATGMQHPWDSGVRESLILWCVRIGLLVNPDPAIGPGLVTSTIFLATGALLFGFVRDITGQAWTAALTMLVLFTNPSLVELARSGLRDTYFLVGLVGLAWVVLSRSEKLSRRQRLVGISIATAWCCGIRITAMTATGLFVIYGFATRKLGWRNLVFPVAAGAIAVVPYMIYGQATYGDPMKMANHHAVWWRNYEFVEVEGVGCDGCPTLEQLEEEGDYAGAPIKLFEYVFGMHPPFQLAERIVKGGVAVFLDPGTHYSRFLLGPPQPRVHMSRWPGIIDAWCFAMPYFLGLALAVRRPALIEVALVPLLFLNVLLFTVTLSMPPRLFSPAAPFMAFAWGVGAHHLGTLLRVREPDT